MVSATGIQQGDPVGPALFSLAIDELVRSLDAEFNVWYLDDGTIGYTPDKVYSCVQELAVAFQRAGLEINQKKCESIILSSTIEERRRTEAQYRRLLPELKVIDVASSTLLGAPLSEEGISAVVLQKAEDL